MSDLIVISYDTKDGASQGYEEVKRLQKLELIRLEDAAVAIKDDKGKLKIKQTLEKEHTGSAALWGSFWGLLIGLFFPATLLWGLFGALLGALIGKGTDLGIDNKFIKQVGASLEEGGSALFLLAIQWTEDRVAEALAKTGGTLYQTNLTKEDEEKLKRVLEEDEVKEAAQESLELE